VTAEEIAEAVSMFPAKYAGWKSPNRLAMMSAKSHPAGTAPVKF